MMVVKIPTCVLHKERTELQVHKLEHLYDVTGKSSLTF